MPENTRKREHDSVATTSTETLTRQPEVKKLRVKAPEKTGFTLLRDCALRADDYALVQRNLDEFRTVYLSQLDDGEKDQSECMIGMVTNLMDTGFNLLIDVLCSRKFNTYNLHNVCSLLLHVSCTVAHRALSLSRCLDVTATTGTSTAYTNCEPFLALIHRLYVDAPSTYLTDTDRARLGARVFRLAHTSLHASSPLARHRAISLLMAARAHNSVRRDLVIILSYLCDDNYGRVRAAAVRAIIDYCFVGGAAHQSQGRHLKSAMTVPLFYKLAKRAMVDHHPHVRLAGIDLCSEIACAHLNLYTRNEDRLLLRLHDDAFMRVCNMMNDEWNGVRVRAAQSLGRFLHVSRHFIEQTLDKKILPCMKVDKLQDHVGGGDGVRRSRSIYNARGGIVDEWALGRNLSEDIPSAIFDYQSRVRLGACGAFVIGLEDEFMKIRCAAIQSLGILLNRGDLMTETYADTVHALADMFNDDVVTLRLHALHSIRPILRHTAAVSTAQLHLVLDVLNDTAAETRMGARHLLANSSLISVTCVRAVIAALLNNMHMYPVDTHSVYRCLQMLGAKHGNEIAALLDQLMQLHPYLKGRQPAITGAAMLMGTTLCEIWSLHHTPPVPIIKPNAYYLAKLIIVLNAAGAQPHLIGRLPDFTWKHYAYLRSCTQLVPRSLAKHVALVPMLDDVKTRLGGAQGSATPTTNQLPNSWPSVVHTVDTLVYILANDKQRLQTLMTLYGDLCQCCDVHDAAYSCLSYLRHLVRALIDTYRAQIVHGAKYEIRAHTQNSLNRIAQARAVHHTLRTGWHVRLMDECRVRLLLIHAAHASVTLASARTLIAGCRQSHLSAPLKELIADMFAVTGGREHTARTTEVVPTVSRLNDVQIGADMLLLDTSVSRVTHVRALAAVMKDTIRLREVILIDPSRGTGTDTGGHHQQNELVGDDEQQTVAMPPKKSGALADNDDVLDDDDTADEMLTVHMRDSIKIVAGMLAAIPMTLQTHNYTMEEILQLRVLIEYAGGRRQLHRLCASNVQRVDDGAEGSDAVGGQVHRVHTLVTLSAPVHAINEQTVVVAGTHARTRITQARLSLVRVPVSVDEQSLADGARTAHVHVSMTNARAICAKLDVKRLR